MATRLSSEFRDLVRSRTDIVDLVGESLTLTPRRHEYIGLCPFHDDHNPSFHVYPERQSYRCWVCNEGGDCFSFVMRTDGVTFPEALEILARRANIEIPRHARAANDPAAGSKPRLYEIVAWAEAEMHRCLLSAPEAAPAREYLASRGFTPETIQRFRLGYHPNQWEWLLNRARKLYKAEELFAARLLRQRDDGSYYDDFVDRVMFPIRDMRGRVVAFGGRVLPGTARDDAPKYLNSPESPLFTKSDLLYGFDAARDGIRRSETAVVVEGYTDCILAHQHGIGNVVGTLGTALTDQHVKLLKRLARKVVQCYDGDDAGRNAAERALARFIAHDVDLRVLTLQGGLDPADFLAQHGTEAFQRLIAQAPELWDHKLQLTFARYGFESIDARQRVLDEMLEMLALAPRLAGSPREHILLSRLSQRVAIPEQQIRRQLGEARKKQSRRPAPQTAADQAKVTPASVALSSQASFRQRTEYELLEVIFAVPGSIDLIRPRVSAQDITDEKLRRLLEICYDLAEQGTVPSFENVTLALEDPELKRLSVQIDESARTKEIARLLHTEGCGPGGTRADDVLTQLIDTIHWRRREQSHERTKGEMAQLAGTSASGGDKKQAELRLLAEMQEFHRQRAARKSQTSTREENQSAPS